MTPSKHIFTNLLLLTTLIAVSALILPSAAEAEGARADVNIPFPKTLGTWWHYTGQAETLETRAEGNPLLRKEITDRRVEIVDAALEGSELAALRLKEIKHVKNVINGTKSNFEIYETVLIFDNKEYFVQPMSDSDWNRLKKNISMGKKIPKPSSNYLELKLPCILGSKWGNASDAPRKDNLYCWNVDAVEVHHNPQEYGFVSPRPVKKYAISMRTGVDTTKRTFMPGVGVIFSSYQHLAGRERSKEKLESWGCISSAAVPFRARVLQKTTDALPRQ